MSQFIQHPATSIKLSFAARKAAWLVSLVVLIVVAATAVILLVSNDSSSSSSASAPSTSNTAPGVRYDGGPDEGTAGVTQQSAITAGPRPYHGGGFNERFDGGPEEGASGH
jgi:hypothetical protein